MPTRSLRASRSGVHPGLWLAAMLVVAGIGVGAAGDSPLADAVQRRDTGVVQSLLKKGVDVNAPQRDGATALHWAAYLDDAETTTSLIRAGANVNARNNLGVTPLALSAQSRAAPSSSSSSSAPAPHRTIR